MYVTATSPYIFMLILCIRMALLPGAGEGLKFYLVPDFSRLKDLEVHLLLSDSIGHCAQL